MHADIPNNNMRTTINQSYSLYTDAYRSIAYLNISLTNSKQS